MYEHRTKPLISRGAFFRRLLAHGGFAFTLIFASLLVGVLGYHVLGELPWIDAILNASMILGGMGPVDNLDNDASKLFAAAYALYSGLVLLISLGILFAPIMHRILHRFHLESDDDEDNKELKNTK